MWHTWTPYFNPQAPPASLRLTVAGTKVGSTSGNWIISEREQVDPLETTAESKSNFLVCLGAWGSQTIWSYVRNSQLFHFRGRIKLASHGGYCVIYQRLSIIKTGGGRHAKKEWLWSYTSAQCLGNTVWTGVWYLSEKFELERWH